MATDIDLIKRVRDAVAVTYMGGLPPEDDPEVIEYMTPDGGLLRALDELLEALTEAADLREALHQLRTIGKTEETATNEETTQ